MDIINPAGEPPLIITAELTPDAQAFFEAQRQRYFPPERNLIPAHITLFHKLPGMEEELIREWVAHAVRTLPVTVDVTGVRFLGQGVAYTLAAPELMRVREDLRQRFTPWLGRQDQQVWRPHLTVQNKVSSDAARSLYDSLQAGFTPWSTQVTALRIWRYRGGPWEAVARMTGPGAAG